MQEITNWFGDQYPQQKVITVTTCNIIHLLLDVIEIIDIHEIPKSLCNITQAKKPISIHPICLTDSEYDYILK